MAILGHAAADDVIALRASLPQEAAPVQSAVSGVLPLANVMASAAKPTDTQAASAAAADDLHEQADAAIPAGSQLAASLADADSQIKTGSQATDSTPGRDDMLPNSASSAGQVKSEYDATQSDPSALVQGNAHVDAETAQDAAFKATAVNSTSKHAGSRPLPSGVTVVRSNPRFASKPIKQEIDAQEYMGSSPESTVKAEGGLPCCNCITPCKPNVVTRP